jgi:cAMP phosphodiesterase
VQLTSWLGNVIKSGEVTLFTGEVEALHIKAAKNKIDFSITNRKFMKDAIDSVGSGSSIMSKLNQLKTIAEDLKEEGLTVTLYYKGDQLVTLGREAKSGITGLVTRTKALEINNLRKLIELAV